MSEPLEQLLDSRALFRRLFDSRAVQAALLDLNGEILETNSGWEVFGRANGLRASYKCVGKNYLDASERAAINGVRGAKEAYVGLLSVIHGRQPKFTMVYPCHSPTERRWHRLWIEPQMPAAAAVVVVHYQCPDDAVSQYGAGSAFGPAVASGAGLLSRSVGTPGFVWGKTMY